MVDGLNCLSIGDFFISDVKNVRCYCQLINPLELSGNYMYHLI